MAIQHDTVSLTKDLLGLGLGSGDGVWVHASMRSIGRVKGGPTAVIEALLAAVGGNGLVGMPGFSDDAYPPPETDRGSLAAEDVARIEHAVTGFDIDRSPTAGMGVIAETFRTWPGTQRSAHPTTSVCIHGPDAAHIIAPHDTAWAMGPASPFGRMRDRPGMKILLIGVDWTRCTPLHTAENYAVHQRQKKRRFKSGPGDALWFETPDVADDLGRLFPSVGAAYEAAGRVTVGRLGDAQVRLCNYADLVRFAAPWISAENEKSGDRH